MGCKHSVGPVLKADIKAKMVSAATQTLTDEFTTTLGGGPNEGITGETPREGKSPKSGLNNGDPLSKVQYFNRPSKKKLTTNLLAEITERRTITPKVDRIPARQGFFADADKTLREAPKGTISMGHFPTQMRMLARVNKENPAPRQLRTTMAEYQPTRKIVELENKETHRNLPKGFPSLPRFGAMQEGYIFPKASGRPPIAPQITVESTERSEMTVKRSKTSALRKGLRSVTALRATQEAGSRPALQQAFHQTVFAEEVTDRPNMADFSPRANFAAPGARVKRKQPNLSRMCSSGALGLGRLTKRDLRIETNFDEPTPDSMVQTPRGSRIPNALPRKTKLSYMSNGMTSADLRMQEAQTQRQLKQKVSDPISPNHGPTIYRGTGSPTAKDTINKKVPLLRHQPSFNSESLKEQLVEESGPEAPASVKLLTLASRSSMKINNPRVRTSPQGSPRADQDRDRSQSNETSAQLRQEISSLDTRNSPRPTIGTPAFRQPSQLGNKMTIAGELHSSLRASKNEDRIIEKTGEIEDMTFRKSGPGEADSMLTPNYGPPAPEARKPRLVESITYEEGNQQSEKSLLTFRKATMAHDSNPFKKSYKSSSEFDSARKEPRRPGGKGLQEPIALEEDLEEMASVSSAEKPPKNNPPVMLSNSRNEKSIVQLLGMLNGSK